MKTTLAIIFSVLALGASVYAIVHRQQITQSFGATSNPGASGLYEQSLAQPLGTTDANMYVTSGTDVQGNLLPLNSYQCLSVDTGQPNFEAICGNVTASASSGLTLAVTLRGLSTQTATTSNSSFIFAHRRGADVRITDFPSLTILTNQMNGAQTIPGPLVLSSHPCNVGSASTTICDKNYIDGQVAAGGSPANNTNAGISIIATAAQAAAGIATQVFNTVTYDLVLPSGIATSTPYNSGTNVVPVTGTNEKLSQLFLDLTQAFTWSGQHIFNGTVTDNATTTIAASNVNNLALVLDNLAYKFPSTRGASSTALEENGSGSLSFEPLTVNRFSTVNSSGVLATNPAYATSTALILAAGTLSASSTIEVDANIACNQSTSACSFFLRDSFTGITLASCSATQSSNVIGTLHMFVTSNSSLTSQAFESNCIMDSTTAGTAFYSTGTAGTSALNTANSVSLVMVVFNGESPSGETVISNYSITVNP